MSTLQEAEPVAVERVVEDTSVNDRTRFFAMMGLMLLSGLPFLVVHLMNLALQPQYGVLVFFPMVFGWLLWSRSQKVRIWIPASTPRSLLALSPGLGLLVLGSAVGSPWLAVIGMVFGWLAVIYLCGSRYAVKVLGPVWSLSLLLVPLPLGWDERLSVHLRRVSTDWTHYLLDLLGVINRQYGSVIEVSGKKLFVADACSGVHSLFVLIAAALTIGIVNRRRWYQTISLLGLAFGLVILENVARLSSVALAWGQGIDLSEGTPHEVLGGCLFAISLLLLLSFDQGIQFVLPKGLSLSGIIRAVRGKDDAVYGTYGTYGTYGSSSRRKKSSGVPEPLPLGTPRMRWMPIFAIACLPLAGFQWMRLPEERVDWSELIIAELTFPEFGLESLPEVMNGFARGEIEQVHRVAGDPLGAHSQIWSFRNNKTKFRVSVDYPFAGAHDNCKCYSNTGWTITSHSILTADGEESSDPENDDVAVARLKHPLYGHAILLFSSISREGQHGVKLNAIQLARTPAPTILGRAQLLIDRDNQQRAESATPTDWYQIQAFVQSPTRLDDRRLEEVVATFRDMRSRLRAMCQEALKSEGP